MHGALSWHLHITVVDDQMKEQLKETKACIGAQCFPEFPSLS